MRKSVDKRIENLLREAESRHACCAPITRADKEALQKRKVPSIAISPRQKLFVRPETWNALSAIERSLWLARGMGSLHPEWVFCLFTAAALHGLYVPHRLLRLIHVAHAQSSCPKDRGIIVHHRKKNLERTYVQGVYATPLLETTIDCLAHLDFAEGLPIADSALLNLEISKRQFIDLIQSSGQYGAQKAVATALHADPRSENGGESMARAVMIEEGFMLPDLQVPIPHPLNKRKTYRVDFLWRPPGQSPVAGEFDGVIKFEDDAMLKEHSVAKTLRQERNREAILTSTGLHVMRFTYDDVRLRNPLVRLMELYGIPRVA